MAKAFTQGFYKSSAWSKARAAYISERVAIDGGICEMCHDQLGKIVHHKAELTPQSMGDIDRLLGLDNLSYVCHACHNKIHMAGERSFRYRISDDGSIVPPSDYEGKSGEDRWGSSEIHRK